MLRPAPGLALLERTLLALALLAPAACGYRLAAGDLRDAGSIAIVTPRNDAGTPGFEFVVADALRRELLRRAGSHLAEDPGQAQIVVKGRILRVQTAPSAYSSVMLALEYETSVELELSAQRGGEVLVAPTRLHEIERHLASADVEAQAKNREEALRRIASVLASRFLDLVGEKVNP